MIGWFVQNIFFIHEFSRCDRNTTSFIYSKCKQMIVQLFMKNGSLAFIMKTIFYKCSGCGVWCGWRKAWITCTSVCDSCEGSCMNSTPPEEWVRRRGNWLPRSLSFHKNNFDFTYFNAYVFFNLELWKYHSYEKNQ